MTIKKYNAMKKQTQAPPATVLGKQLFSGEITENRFDSQALFAGHREVLIEHAGHVYRLRITRQDKLILTK